LKTASKPTISIDGTVADLYRMGYADQPIKLHDIALVEVLPAGYKAQIQIIKMTVDLLDPSATTLTIGAYIPNIIYIEKENNFAATGSRGGGGGNKSKQSERSIYETEFEKNNRLIRLHAYELKDLDSQVKVNEATIKVQSDRITAEVFDRRESDRVLSSSITQTATAINAEVVRAKNAENTLSGRITVNADKVSLVVEEKDGQNVVRAASIVAGINAQTGSYVTIQANKINLSGYVTASQLNATNAEINNLKTGQTAATSLRSTSINASSIFVFRSTNVSWKEKTLADGTTIHYLGY